MAWCARHEMAGATTRSCREHPNRSLSRFCGYRHVTMLRFGVLPVVFAALVVAVGVRSEDSLDEVELAGGLLVTKLSIPDACERVRRLNPLRAFVPRFTGEERGEGGGRV